MVGGFGRDLPVISSTDPFIELPVPIRGDPAAGVKLVPAAVNRGFPVKEAVSKPEAAEYVLQAARVRPAAQE